MQGTVINNTLAYSKHDYHNSHPHLGFYPHSIHLLQTSLTLFSICESGRMLSKPTDCPLKERKGLDLRGFPSSHRISGVSHSLLQNHAREQVNLGIARLSWWRNWRIWSAERGPEWGSWRCSRRREAGKCGVEVGSVGVGAGRWEVEDAKNSRWWSVSVIRFCHDLTHRDYGL